MGMSVVRKLFIIQKGEKKTIILPVLTLWH